MDRPISPVFSSSETPAILAADDSPLESTDSLQISAAIETISFKIFSWLSTDSQKKTHRKKNEKRCSAPANLFPLDNMSLAKHEQPSPGVRNRSTRANSLDNGSSSRPVLSSPKLSRLGNKPPTTEEMLKENKFVDLAKKIKQHQTYPWSEFRKYQSPILIEQLVDLYELLKLKDGKLVKTEQDKILRFALDLAKEKHLNQKRIVGELISLTDKQPHKALQSIMPGDTLASVDSIHQGFVDELQAINSRLLSFKNAHSYTGIQNKHIATRNQLPVEIAQILISETGRVNVGIIGSLLEVFLQNSDKPINYEINLAYALRLLQVSPELREKLSHIPKPSSSKAPSNVVIRTTLGLSRSTPITRGDAIKTTLSALLSHLRQGSDGSCFATPLAIELLSSHLGKCIDDFATLLESSKLTRKVENNSTYFPFLLRMGKKNLDNHLVLTREGLIVREKNDSGHIWEAPGIIAACQTIGIDNPSSDIPKVLEGLFLKAESKDKPLEITVNALLKAIVRHASKFDNNQEEGIIQLYIKACFAFEAQETNPLLQVWENAIAGMAEADKSSMVKSTLICSVTLTLQRKIDELLPGQDLQQKILSETLQTNLIKKAHLQYDPAIANGGKSKDQQSTEGAFVLYEKNNDTPPRHWTRVDNPTAFQKFVLNVVHGAKKSLEKKRDKLDTQQCKELHQVIKELSSYVETTEFILTCLKRYEGSNIGIENPFENYKQIQYTPWVTKTGNSFSKVFQIYTEGNEQDEQALLSPLNSQELLLKIIEMGKTFSDTEKETYQSNPNRLIPIRIPGIHAFSLMLGHPTLTQAWNKDDDTNEWIIKHVVTPGKEVSKAHIGKDTREAVIKLASKKLINPDQISVFLKLAHSIQKEISIKEFRKKLIKHILSLELKMPLSSKEIALQLDTFLYQSLPDKDKTLLENSAVHFADTNWSEGIYDIHFCFTINPGNGKLEIWRTRGNGKNMFALDQNLWLKNKEWEIFSAFSKFDLSEC